MRISVYWLVDPDGGQAEAWSPGDAPPALECERLTWRPKGAGLPFVLALAEPFEAI